MSKTKSNGSATKRAPLSYDQRESLNESINMILLAVFMFTLGLGIILYSENWDAIGWSLTSFAVIIVLAESFNIKRIFRIFKNRRKAN